VSAAKFNVEFFLPKYSITWFSIIGLGTIFCLPYAL
jgi:hypothetical protein